MSQAKGPSPQAVLQKAEELRGSLSEGFRDQIVEGLYAQAERVVSRAVTQPDGDRITLDQRIDSLVTSPVFGLPIMLALLAGIFWLTVAGANVPSEMLSLGLFWLGDKGSALFESVGSPEWLTGFLWDGVYKATAWVVSVMLPPMAIFFPLFTMLEDLGYLPRVAFNMDWLYKKVGAHGKQALTHAMGFGCNAAGVVSTRIIDSPRERLIAVITNNFAPCNGRFPTLIMLATVFVAAGYSAAWSSFIAAGTVLAVVLLGFAFSLAVSWILSRSVLKGEPSAFTLELPPYRRPNVLWILYTSLIDRTVFVLFRAVATAVPAGAVIWILGNIHAGGKSLAWHVADFLEPLGTGIGLDGVILLAYIIAIPANEIVVPTIMMMYLNAGSMTEPTSLEQTAHILVEQQGWTLLTAICLMLFSLLHNPCGTTIITIWKETRSGKWTAVAALLPLAIGFTVCFLVAQVWRIIAGS